LSAPAPLVRMAVAMPPAQLLRLLADAADGEQAAVAVHLAGGHIIEGILAGLAAGQGSGAVVLADADGARLRYASLADVIAVEVRNPRPFQDVLTAGAMPLPVTGEPVTRIALERRFPASDAFPVRVHWAGLPDAEPVLPNLAALLGGLRESVARVRADEIGLRAWQHVRAVDVEHRDGTRLSAQPIADGIAIHGDLTAALPRGLADEMFRIISAVL
jgi:hypothetical protein